MADKHDAAEEKLVLKAGVILQFLGDWSWTPDREGAQLTELSLSNKRVETLPKSLEEVKDVQKVDLSVNNLGDITPLRDLHNLVKINVCKNKIKNLALFTTEDAFPNLKWLDVSANKFTEFPAFKCPKLEYLDVSFNKLEKVNEGWTGHEKLRVIRAVDNKFKSLAPFKAMPNLEELNMASNVMAALQGWEALPKLRKLNLKRNKIASIEEEGLPELPALEKIHLHGNKIPSLEILFRLFQFPLLVDINVLRNPVETSCSSLNLLTAEVLLKNTKIQRFCKVTIAESNKLEAVHLADYRW